jgi:hypothetical protein
MATNGHDDAPNAEVNPQSMKQGHEPDTVNLRAILYVPVVLVICFFFTYLIVTKIIEYARAPVPTPNTLAAKNNEGSLDQRLSRISSDDEKAKYKQPRLEGAQLLESNDPLPFVRSYDPSKEGNSPQYHPEDMRPSSAHGKDLGLQEYKWVDEKNGIVRLPVEEAMKIVLEAKNPKDSSKKYILNGTVELKQLQPDAPKQSNPQLSGSATEKPKEDLHHSPKGPHP